MTDKQINDIANIISAKVIEFIEQKQQEFDKEWLSAHQLKTTKITLCLS